MIDAAKPFRKWTGTETISDLLAIVEEVQTFLDDPNSQWSIEAMRTLLKKYRGADIADVADIRTLEEKT